MRRSFRQVPIIVATLHQVGVVGREVREQLRSSSALGSLLGMGVRASGVAHSARGPFFAAAQGAFHS